MPDLKILEESGLMKKGTCIFADNIFYPGCPEYVKYLKDNPRYDTTYLDGSINRLGIIEKDTISVSIYQG